MKKEDIYIIKNCFLKTGEWNTDNIAFRDMDKAIEYCESKLNSEELEEHNKQLRRNLISWYEFSSKNYLYEIKVVNLV